MSAAVLRGGPVAALRALLGEASVSDSAQERVFQAHDIAGPAPIVPLAVAAPGDAESVRRLVAFAAAEGIALHPRGGGWSYTGGYQPSHAHSVIVDLRRLDAISVGEGSVCAGAGATWAAVDAALAPLGRRVPSFGPLSGLVATVGGTASQDGGFFGAAGHGTVRGSIAGLALVDGRARVLALHRDGPDVDGMTLGDAVGDGGALGLKVAVTLDTMRRPAETGFASHAFGAADDALGAVAALAGTPGLAEVFAFDPEAHRNLAATGFTLGERAGLAAELMGDGVLRGVVALARAAVTRATVGELCWSLHVVAEGGAAVVAAALTRAAEVARRHHGTAIPDTIPRVTRAKPFRLPKGVLGPRGERWLPVHGVVPAGEAAAAAAACAAVVADALRDDPALRVSTLVVLMGDRAVVEPQILWADVLHAFHRGAAPAALVAAHGGVVADPAARGRAHALRAQLRDTLSALGASQFGTGRYYAQRDARRDRLARLAVALDPAGVINPGVLDVRPGAPSRRQDST